MRNNIVIYVNEKGNFQYGFANRKNWKYINIDLLKEKNLQYVEGYFSNGAVFSVSKEKAEKRLKNYVNELNIRKKKGEDVKLPISLDLIIDPEAITEDLWKN